MSSETDVQLPLIADVAPLVAAAEPFVVFEVPVAPRGWERPGAVIRRASSGIPFIHWYVREEETTYRTAIAWSAKAAMRGKVPTRQPVAMVIHAFVAIPASWPWKKKMAARAGMIAPTGTPDWDNIGKVASDALKEIVWGDDAAVIDGRVIKRYSDKAALRVEIREMLPPNVC